MIHSLLNNEEASLLANLVEHSSEAIVTIDRQFRIYTWNKGAEKLFGYSRPDAIGKTLEELHLFDSVAERYIAFIDALSTHQSFKTESLLYRRDGITFYASIIINIVLNTETDEERLIVIVKDLSEQQQLATELLELNQELETRVREKTMAVENSEYRIRAMIEHNDEIVTMANSSGEILYRSPSATRITGWSNSEMKKVDSIYQQIHPDDKTQVSNRLAELRSSPGKLTELAYRLQHKAGQYIYLVGSVINLLDDARVQAIIFNMRDATERIERENQLRISRDQLKEREEQLELYIKYSPIAIAMFDQDMRYLATSQRWKSDFKIDDRNVIGKSHYEVFPGISDELKQVHQRCLKGASEKRDEEATLLHDGALKYSRWEIRPWRNADESIGGIIIFTEDISVQKKALEKAQQSEDKYRRLIERIADGFVAMDLEWKFTYVNSRAASMIGKPADELIGKSAWTVFPQIEGNQFHEGYKKAIRTQQNVYMDEYSAFLDRWVRVNIYPSESGLSVFLRDITSEKKAKIAQTRSDNIRQLIMESALDAIVCIDKTGIITVWNSQAKAMFGWTEKEALGKSLTETIIPASQHHAHSAGLERHLATNEARMLNRLLELNAVNKAGEDIPIEMFVVKISDEDDFFFCSFIRDISLRKQSERKILQTQLRLKQAQKIAHIGHWDSDPVSHDSKWSEEACAIFGVSQEEQLNERNWLSFVHPEDLPNVNAHIANSLEQAQGTSFYHRIIRPDGAIRHLYTESRYEFDEEKKRNLLYGIVHDITNIKKLEEELLEQQRREQLMMIDTALKAQEKERNSIGAELHDNVNQLLVATKMMLAMLKEHPEMLEKVLTSSLDNLQAAINENRKIAHELVTPNFDGRSLAGQLTELAESMLDTVGIHTIVDIKGLNEQQLTEETKLTIYRIAQEQCTNIIKYAAAKKVEIRLHSNDYLHMSIADDGKGMSAKQKEDGIGLRNIKGRVSVLGGSVIIFTKPDKGFRLEVKIPLKQ